MFHNKIKSGASGILTYGITPPKSETPSEKIPGIASRTIERILPLDIDALVVYDVQDEAARTSEERPFPFLKAHDPFEYAATYLQELNIPKIIYRPAGKFDHTEISDWLEKLQQNGFYPVFVGVPAPDHVVKTSLSEAYGLWKKHEQKSVVGAVMIPERHAALKDEDKRILDKAAHGVSFFISQCVFDTAYAKQVVDDLCFTSRSKQTKPPTIIFTLTACGSLKTLEFMQWLGIHVADELKEDLKGSENMLQKSVQICLDIAAELTDFCAQRCLSFGFNIESVAIRKEEIEASIAMVEKISEMLYKKGLRDMPYVMKGNKL